MDNVNYPVAVHFPRPEPSNMQSFRVLAHRTARQSHQPCLRPSNIRQVLHTRPNQSLVKLPQSRLASNFGASSQPSFRERFKEQLRLARKDYPVIFPALLVASVASVSLLSLLIYDYYTRVAPQYAAYPPLVEQALRMGLQHVYVTPDPEKAEMHLTHALKMAHESGMDPYSPEVIGIRTRLAEMLEKFGRAKGAIEVLDGTINMCEEKVADIDRGVTSQDPEQTKSLRSGMLRTILRCRAKVASLYEGEYMRNTTKAKEVLSDAIGLLVKETQNPQTKGFSEDNAAGLPLDEIASMLSQMGDLYATTGEESNAVQVYMLTLAPLRQACNGNRSCKEVQVLSNIASTMDIAMKKPGATINGQPANKENLAAARKAILAWADQAIKTAEVVKPEDRDSVCDLGLISAEMTKADLLLKDGKTIQAREAFRGIIPKLREKGLESLVRSAEQGIQRAGG
ncbi:hypothetical protein LTR64_002306 [Lithohypha guttulata]|uniref:uncharacterized protein n=1 Tax=Lithohypha guttulata TaxID=1690604 RepID=UPI002DDF636C|nr:hypothetical protein LTR51_001468 [Lithohypha guttulata]